MLIDWFTVGAQALNFLVLVWLLKRFLYGPILNAIDAREARIAAELADADEKRSQAEDERAEFERKNAQLDEKRAELLHEAAVAADAERQRLFDAARQQADAWSETRREMLRGDAARLNATITRRAQDEVFAIARKTLADLAGSSLEQRITDVFTDRLRALGDNEKHALTDALASTSEPALVRTAFELPAPQRAAIQQVLDERFHAGTRIRFEVAPTLVSGIELVTNGQKVAWSIAGHLASLERVVDALLDKPQVAPPPPGRETDPAPTPSP